MRAFAVGLALGVSLMVPAIALAQKPTADQQRVACTPDAFRLCSHEIPNLGRIIQCLRINKSSLSAGCRAMFDASEKRPRAATRGLSTDQAVGAPWCTPLRPGEPPGDVWAAWCEERVGLR